MFVYPKAVGTCDPILRFVGGVEVVWFTFAKIAFANDVAVFIPTNECVVRYVYDVRLTH